MKTKKAPSLPKEKRYPRYSYRVKFKRKRKIEVWPLMAWGPKAAMRQAIRLCEILEVKLISVTLVAKVNWSGYNVPWKTEFENESSRVRTKRTTRKTKRG